MTRDFFEDRKGPSERLDADALAIVGVVVDVGLRDGTSRAIVVLRGLAGLSLVFGLVRDFTESGLHMRRRRIYRPPANQQRHAPMQGHHSLYHNIN